MAKRGAPLLGWLSYDEARQIARTRGIKSRREYFIWHKKNRIQYLPARPNRVYEDVWTGWNDFLGNSNSFNQNKPKHPYRPYWDSVRYIHTLGLKTIAEWHEYKWSGELPPDIPKAPEVVYSDHWSGYKNWLGVDAAAKTDLVSNTKQNAMWVLLHEQGDPTNVFWWKTVASEHTLGEWLNNGSFRLVKKFKYEPEINTDVKELFARFTKTYYDDPAHIMVNNPNEFIWELGNLLLSR